MSSAPLIYYFVESYIPIQISNPCSVDLDFDCAVLQQEHALM